MLTEEEKEIAMSAKNFGLGWGQILSDGSEVYCPAGAVAKSRGVIFSNPGSGLYMRNHRFLVPSFDERFDASCIDVAKWLGFATWHDYTAALQVERADILKRAKP